MFADIVADACVIGAGASGLVTARYLRDAGLKVCVYELAECLGGVWVLRSPACTKLQTPMYARLNTNLPGDFMAFSDHPFPFGSLLFPPHEEVLAYLDSYAERFSLRPLIHFETEVIDVEWDSAKSNWNISSRDSHGQISVQAFKRVVVCSGHYHCPNMPKLHGSEDFPGSIFHSMDYYDEDKYAGKSVLIIGTNPSGGDIASLVAKHAAGSSVHLSSRKPPDFVTKKLVGPALKCGAKLHGDVMRLTPKSTVVFNGLHEAWAMPEESVQKELHIDAIICCTGYLYNFPFLRQSGVEEQICGDGTSTRHLYRRVFYSQNDSLAFIGTANQLVPSWPVFEQQARWLAGVWSGRLQLPSKHEMEMEAMTRHTQQPTPSADRDNLALKTPAYCNELARLSGAEGYYKPILRSKLWRMVVSSMIGKKRLQSARL